MSPPDSHASNGAEEVTLQQIRGFYRTPRIQLESQSGQPVSNESSLAVRLIRDAPGLCTRFAVGQGQRTPFERLQLRRYRDHIQEFGEQVQARHPGTETGKLAERYSP